jgi:hypothetical protein
MNVLWETMVAEMRAERLEADNRRHFTPEKESIELVRGMLAEWTLLEEQQDLQIIADKTAMNMRMAADNDLFEVG